MIKTLLKNFPGVSDYFARRDAHRLAYGFVPPGHFYSPLVSIDDARQDEARIFRTDTSEVPGIDLNERAQLERLSDFEKLYPSIDFPEFKAPSHRYYYENTAYSYSDAIMLHCMIRTLRPSRIIEVGSGFSSCVMLDTNERHLAWKTALTFIEPYPELLKSLLREGDLARVEIIPTRVQEVPLDVFSKLQAGDILFIDSTHVSKTGSDVNFLLFDVLPALTNGVYIHFHDIFYPFEYPKDWVFGGRSWNEIYALRAFLQFNPRFSIELMNTFLEISYEKRFTSNMPLCLKNRGGSIWLQKH